MKKIFLVIIISLTFISCKSNQVRNDDARNYASEGLNNVRRRVRVDEFTNKTIYGEGRFEATMADAIKSEADLSNKFEVLARDENELNSIKKEIQFSNSVVKKNNQNLRNGINMKEAEFALSGSLTEFSIEIFTKNSLTSQKKIQKTRAAVELKLLNMYTGSLQSFPGEAEIEIERGTTLGLGEGKSSYAQREEEAVRRAVIGAMNKAMIAMDKSAWSIKGRLQGGKIYLPVGKESNLDLNTKLAVSVVGEAIILDGEEIYTEENLGIVKVNSYLNGREGSICEFVGNLPNIDKVEVIVREI